MRGAILNRALWAKTASEACWLLLSCASALFAFAWLFVWLVSLIKLPDFRSILGMLPPQFQNLIGLSLAEAASPAGRIGLCYVDPAILLVSGAWAVARGSDAVSGEIGRGTMEMLLAQPVRRIAVLWTQAAVTIAGAAVISLAAWLGTCIGLHTVTLDEQIDAWQYAPSAVNLFALTFFVAGISTLASSWDRYRWRTIGIVCGFYMVELIVKIVYRMAPDLDWLRFCTFLGAYEPQAMAARPETAWELSLGYDATLIALGLAAYLFATVIFCRRDLPAPL